MRADRLGLSEEWRVDQAVIVINTREERVDMHRRASARQLADNDRLHIPLKESTREP